MATVTNIKAATKAAPRKTAPRVVRSKKDLARQTATMGAVASVALTVIVNVFVADTVVGDQALFPAVRVRYLMKFNALEPVPLLSCA